MGSKLWEHIKKEWDVLKTAPLTFVVLLVLAFGFACWLFNWLHGERFASLTQQISNKDSTNELLKERIQGKDDQLTEYRAKNLELQARVTSVPAVPATQPKKPHKEQFRQSATRFSNASNRELASFAATLANHIRQVAQNIEAALQANPSDARSALTQGMSSYFSNYQADAIVLKDEIMSRLPLVKRDSYADSMYNMPTNPIGLFEVAKDLDRLGKMLPPK